MNEIPKGICIDDLPGPERGKAPALYVRDEVVLSPNGRYFALAYTIFEASYGNETGCVLWGRVEDERGVILGNPPGVHTCCWWRPWCKWVDEETFIFKAQNYDGRHLHLPLVAINVNEGFSVLPDTTSHQVTPEETDQVKLGSTTFAVDGLLEAILKA